MDRFNSSYNKFLPPPLPRVLLKRQEILWLIKDIEYVKICGLIAPAGYGKSTSVNLFAHYNQNAYAFRWLSLQPFDQDFYTFLNKFASALGTLSSDFTDSFWIKYEGIGLKSNPDESLAQHFGYEIGQWLDDILTEELILILDDYHYVNNSPEIKTFMTGFIDGTPAHLKLMFTSRTALNLNTMKYMADQRYLEVSSDELRFTESEVKELLSLNLTDAQKTSLSGEFIHQLHDLTGGWAGSLVLAISRLRKEKSNACVLFDLSQTKDTINKYLSEQVFGELSGGLQLFLLASSVSSSFSKSLGNKLFSEIQNYKSSFKFLSDDTFDDISSNDIINELSNAQLLTQSEDEQAEYHIHQLLRDFLISKVPADIRNKLYLVCGRHYEKTNPVMSFEFHILAAHPRKCIAQLWDLLDRSQDISLTRLKSKLSDIGSMQIEADDQKKLIFLNAKLEHLLGNISASQVLLQELEKSYRLVKNSHLYFHTKLLTIENNALKPDFVSNLQICRDLISELKKKNASSLQPILAKTLIHLAYSLAQVSNDFEGIKTSLDALNEAWVLARELKDEHLMEHLLRINYFVASEYDLEEVNKKFNERYARIETANPKVRIDLLKDYAFMHISFGNYALASPKISESMVLAENYSYESALATLRFLNAECKSAEGKFSEAHNNYQEAATYFKSLSPSNALAILYMQVTNAFYSKSHQKLVDAFTNADTLYKSLPNPTHANKLHKTLCEMFYALASDDYESSESACNSLISEFEPATRFTITSLSELYLFLAYIYYRKGSPDFADTLSKFFSLIKDIPKDQSQTAIKRHWRLAELILKSAQDKLPSTHPLFHEIQNALDLVVAQKQSLGMFRPLEKTEKKETAIGFQSREMLRIQTFGQFKLSLFYDDELGQKREKIISDQSFPNSASLQAFKILLIEHHNTVSTDQLIEYIWPNSYSEFHQKMLQNAISAIRKTFYKNGILSRQADFLVKTESGYTLNLGKRGIDYIADVEEFLLLIKKAKEVEKEGLAKMCAMLYQDAIELYQGDFLENDRFEIWVAFTQGNLKDHYLQALLYLAEYNFQNNQLAQTENFCNRILTLDPISETAYEILIKTCRKRKLLSKAHKVFRRCKKAYRKELNTFPPLHIERLIKNFN